MNKRRGNGDGSWRKRNNRIEFIVSIYNKALDRTQRKSFYGKTKAECQQKYIEYISENKEYADESTLTMWADRFLRRCEVNDLKNATLLDYINLVNNHIKKSAIAKLPMADILPIHIEDYLASYSSSSASMRKKLRWILFSLFDMAIENKACTLNPCKNVKVRTSTKKATPDNTYTVAECALIRNTCIAQSGSISLGVLILLYTGMRQGELLGLQWGDIDCERRVITICRTACADGHGAKYIDQRTKREASTRTLPLLDRLAEILTNASKRSLFIVCTKDGDYYNPKAFNRLYKRFISNIDMVRPLGTHAFRHALITHLGNEGASVDEISRIVGHSDTETTRRVYLLYDEKRSLPALEHLPY